MLGVYASAAAVLLASLVRRPGAPAPAGAHRGDLAGRRGRFRGAAVAAPLLIRLPGRATTVAILVACAVAGRALLPVAHPRSPAPRRLPACPWP